MKNENHTAIEELSANVIETHFEDLDDITIKNAKLRIIDVLGCAIGGTRGPGNRPLVELVAESGGRQESTIIGLNTKVPVTQAAMVNSIMARSYDFEVMSPLIAGKNVPSHIAGTTTPTALAVGEARNISGRELITALVTGDNLASRVLAASGPGFSLGWDSVGMVNMLGAAAIAGRIFGLTKLQLRNAFGLALNQMCGTFQSIWDGTTAFKLHQGTSARDGIFSAQIAQAGWTGAEDALLSRFGYFNLYTDGCINPDILVSNLGQTWYADSTFKAYPCCRATHAALDCVMKLLSVNDFSADEIDSVLLQVPSSHLENFIGQPFLIREFPQGDAAFSYRYTVASAIIRRSVLPEHFHEESVRDESVHGLISKISIEEFPGARKLLSRVIINLKDGREFSEFTDTPTGDPTGNPLSDGKILNKFRKNVQFSGVISQANGELLLEQLRSLEQIPSLDSITEMLRNNN